MLIYGKNSKTESSVMVDVKCTNCGTDEISMVVAREYAHLFWIPFFPMRRVAFTSCPHCKQVLTEKEMPRSYKDVLEDVKGYKKAPLWMWTGVFLIAALFVYGSYLSDENKAENENLIQNPAIGNIYEWKNDGVYTFSKVIKVANDSVELQWSDMVTNNIRMVIKARKAHTYYFNDSTSRLSKKDLKSMLESERIQDVYETD